MASLTDISIVARRVIRYGVYILILILVVRFAARVTSAIYQKFFPPKPPPPNVAFGKLPELPFPEGRSSKNLTYTLETVEGKLPTFPNQIEVYSMPASQPNIKVVDEAKKKAQALGFTREGRVLLETIPNVYVFDKEGLPSNLTMNIVTSVFSISYNIEEDPLVLRGLPPSQEEATLQAQGLLSGAGLSPEDLRSGPVRHEFLNVEGGQFVKAISQSEADLTKVNLFRKGLGADANIPSVTPDMPEANVWFIISGGRGRELVAAEYHYFPIDVTKFGTYPVKTAEQAWEELKASGGYVTNRGGATGDNIIIRKVYLSYYDAGQYTPYYQPVVVFEGDNDFYAFVPAVTEEFYGESEEK